MSDTNRHYQEGLTDILNVKKQGEKIIREYFYSENLGTGSFGTFKGW